MDDKELKELYARAFSIFFDAKNPVSMPVAVMLAGQPGAGKTTLIKQLLSQNLIPSNSIHLSLDRIHTCHPEFYKQQYNKYFRSEIHELVRPILESLTEKCKNQNYNMTYDRISSDADKTVEEILELKQKGFKVEVHCLSVNYMDSLLSLCKRYESSSNNEPPQWMPLDIHDYSYYAFPESVRAIFERTPDVQISVWKREGVNFSLLCTSQDHAKPDQASPYEMLITNRLSSNLTKKELLQIPHRISNYDEGAYAVFGRDMDHSR